MEDALARWALTLMWLSLGGGIAILLLTAILSTGAHHYVASFYLILISTSHLVRPTRPRLANVCAVLAFGAAIAYVVLVIMRITR